MAYIKKASFEIINSDSRCDYKEGDLFAKGEYEIAAQSQMSKGAAYHLDEYFEVDEFIALPVAELNKKGYQTEFCCSGHVFKELGDYVENGILEFCEQPNNYCYISFVTKLSFPALPEGFSYDPSITSENKTLIEKEYISKEGTIERVLEIAKTMADLYSWVLTLENKI